MLDKTRLPRLLLVAAGSLALVVSASLLSVNGSLAQTPPTATPAATQTPTVSPTRPAGTTTPGSSTPAAPTTTPVAATATPSGPSPCTQPLARATGGQVLEYQQIELTLPAGDYVYGFIDSGPSSPALLICNTQTDATIYLGAINGQQLARRASTPQGESVLNALQAAVRARGSSGGGTGGSFIQPPNTGDAGLR